MASLSRIKTTAKKPEPAKTAAKPAAAKAASAPPPKQTFGVTASAPARRDIPSTPLRPPAAPPSGGRLAGAPYKGEDILKMEARDANKAREMTREQNAYLQKQPGGWNEQQLADYQNRMTETARANVGLSYQDKHGWSPKDQMTRDGSRYLPDTPENRAAFDALPAREKNGPAAYLAKKFGKVLNPEFVRTSVGDQERAYRDDLRKENYQIDPNSYGSQRIRSTVNDRRAGLGMAPYPGATTTNPFPPQDATAGGGGFNEGAGGSGAPGAFQGLKSQIGGSGGYGQGMGGQANSGPPPLTPGPTPPGGNSSIPSSMGGSMPWGQVQNGPRQMPYQPAPSYPGQGTGGAAIDQLRSRPGNSWDGNGAWTDPKTPPPDDSWPWKPGGGNGSVSPGGGAQQKQATQGGQPYGGQTSTSTNAEYNPNQNAAYNNTARQRMNTQQPPQPAQQFGGPVYQPQQQAPAPQAPAPQQQAPQAPTMPQAPTYSNDTSITRPGEGMNFTSNRPTWEHLGMSEGAFKDAWGMPRGGGLIGTAQYRSPEERAASAALMAESAGVQARVNARAGQFAPFGSWESVNQGGFGLDGPSSLNGFGGQGGYRPEGMGRQDFGGGGTPQQPPMDATMDWWRNRNGMGMRPGDADFGNGRGGGDMGAFVPGMGMRSGMKPQQPRVANDTGFYAPTPAPEQSVMAPPWMEQQIAAPAVMPDNWQMY